MRTAPGNYELQDLVCIELVLRFGRQAVDRFVVEPDGGEDGSLFTTGASPLHYEVRRKGAAGQVTVAELAKWLTHFPELGDRDMLLERLVADPAKRLVVVAAGRVADALDPLVAPAEWRGARFDSVDAAERFLLDTAPGSRIAVVDDPLGGAHPIGDPDRQLHRLEMLLPRLSSRRRLVVVQGRERLLEVAAVADLVALSHHGHPWIDLGLRTMAFRADLWLELGGRAGVLEPLRTTMADALLAGTVRLEAGSLEFLAFLPAAADGSMPVAAAERAASADAMTLFRALRAEARSRDLLPALALASEPRAPATWGEVAFVAGAGAIACRAGPLILA